MGHYVHAIANVPFNISSTVYLNPCYFKHVVTLDTTLNSLVNPDGQMPCLKRSQYSTLSKLKCIYNFSAIMGSSLTVNQFKFFKHVHYYLTLDHPKYIRNERTERRSHLKTKLNAKKFKLTWDLNSRTERISFRELYLVTSELNFALYCLF